VFIILKQRIDTIKVEADDSIHNDEDVIGMETDGICVPERCEPEVSHILRSFFNLFFFGGGCSHVCLCVVLHASNY
jgi:hypothetical protein